MKKTYKIDGLSGYRMLTGSRIIEFRRSNILHPCCFYSTANVDIQSIIENSKKFKKGEIIIYDVTELETSDTVNVVEIKDNMQVKSITSAINILVNKYGAKESELKTIEDVVAKARECGIRFVKLEEKYADTGTVNSEKEESDRKDEAEA